MNKTQGKIRIFDPRKQRQLILYLKRQSLSFDKELVLKTFIWLCHEYICLCFINPQVFMIKPLNIKYDEYLTMLPFVDVEWSD